MVYQELKKNYSIHLEQGPKKKKKLTKEEKAKLRVEELERIKREEELERFTMNIDKYFILQ